MKLLPVIVLLGAALLGSCAGTRLASPDSPLPAALATDATGNARTTNISNCPLGGQFAVLKTSQQWDITYRGRRVTSLSHAELRDIYGGDSIPYSCSTDDDIAEQDYFGFRMGWKRDLFLGYGIVRNAQGQPTHLRRLHYFAHDSQMRISERTRNSLLINYGRNGDLYARFCFNPTTAPDNTWWHNATHRGNGNRGPCVANTWPWSYANSGERLLPL